MTFATGCWSCPGPLRPREEPITLLLRMPGFLRPRDWPIAVRMSCDLLVAALVPLLLATWLSGSRSGAALAKEARSNLALLAQVTATRLDQLFTDAQRALEQIAGDDRIQSFVQAKTEARSALEPAVQRRLELAAGSNPDYAFVMLLDLQGNVVATTDATTVGKNYAFRDYFKAPLATKSPYLSELLMGSTTKRPGVFASSPVLVDGAVVGVMVVKLQGERVWELVDEAAPGRTATSMLTDRHGVIIAHSARERLYRSIAELPTELVQEIDPKASYLLDSIEVEPMPELVQALVRERQAGSAEVRLPGAEGRSEPFEAGFAPMATKSWSVTVLQPYREFAAPLEALRRQQLAVVILVAALSAAYALWRARGIVKPIRSLTDAAGKVALGDFDARADVRGTDELGRLGAAFNQMIPRLREHLDLRQSLALAMDVQQALLPSADPRIEGLDVAGRSTYCDETGGDYYDFIDVSELSQESMLVALGDVMGHGVASALLMASARAALRAAAVEGADLASLLTRVNRVLAADARHGRFMTMVIARIDVREGLVTWASAAHDPIILYDPTADRFEELEGGDLPLGVADDVNYVEYRREGLTPGTVLLLGTDGIWETRNAEDEMFGKDRLMALLKEHATAPASAIADAIDDAIARFRGEGRVLDDITFVVVRLAPRTADASPLQEQRSPTVRP